VLEQWHDVFVMIHSSFSSFAEAAIVGTFKRARTVKDAVSLLNNSCEAQNGHSTVRMTYNRLSGRENEIVFRRQRCSGIAVWF